MEKLYKKSSPYIAGWCAILLFLLGGCPQTADAPESQPGEESSDPQDQPDEETDPPGITQFIIAGIAGLIDEDTKTITLILPWGTSLNSLSPEITLTEGAVISPPSGEAQDFTGPVEYTLTLEGVQTRYQVIVSTADPNTSDARAITSFIINGIPGTIEEAAKTITLILPFGTDLKALRPEIGVSAQAQVSPLSGEAQNFTNAILMPKKYRVTAENGMQVEYKVTVQTAAQNSFTLVLQRELSLSPKSVSLSKAKAESVSVSAAKDYDRYQWYIDGKPAGTDSRTITLKAADYFIGAHYLSDAVDATGNGVSLEYIDFVKVQTGLNKGDGVTHATASTLVKTASAVPRSGGTKAQAATCIEFSPAPGQFVGRGNGYSNPVIPNLSSLTEEEVRDLVQEYLDGNKTFNNANVDGQVFSLGGWGGYYILGFDHSVPNASGADLRIPSNHHVAGMAEAGVVWVSQDSNGDGKPNELWYQLKGSQASPTKGYAMAYFKPTDASSAFWIDTQGGAGTFSYYSNGNDGYPYHITGRTGTYVLFTGTLLQDSNLSGYVDAGTLTFDLSDAVDAAGNGVSLEYIDFVKVQTGLNKGEGSLGEYSPEAGIPQDLHFGG